MVEYGGQLYSYLHNLQGDIIGIVDAAGNLVVEYRYDAWGKPIYEAGSLLSSLGHLNPFRYRGYVWDEETGFYYLRSRYYSSITKRFLNSDILVKSSMGIIGCNMYVYCANNVINLRDSSGERPTDAMSVKAETSKQRSASMSYMRAQSYNANYDIKTQHNITTAEINTRFGDTVYSEYKITIIPHGYFAAYFTYCEWGEPRDLEILGNIIVDGAIDAASSALNCSGIGYLFELLDVSNNVFLKNVANASAVCQEAGIGEGIVIVEHESFTVSNEFGIRPTIGVSYISGWNGEDVFSLVF